MKTTSHKILSPAECKQRKQKLTNSRCFVCMREEAKGEHTMVIVDGRSVHTTCCK